jgi:hypothetical protein
LFCFPFDCFFLRLANAVVEAVDVELYGRAVLSARKVGGMEQAVMDNLPANDFRVIDDKVQLILYQITPHYL